MFDVRLLGGASIEGEQGPLSGPAVQRHRLAVLALLAAAYPQGMTRDKLAALLWPKRDGAGARSLLNQAVHHLRKVLGSEAVLSTADELRLGTKQVRVDLIEFRETLDASNLERAVGLYGGPFLDGFFVPGAVEFERRVDGERQRLRQDYLRALEDLAESATAAGDRRAAVDWCGRAAAEDPYNARFTLGLMEALEASGDRAQAIRRGEEHGERLERELGAEANPEVVALVARMRAMPRALESATGREPAGSGPEPAGPKPRWTRGGTAADAATVGSDVAEADSRSPLSAMAARQRPGRYGKAIAVALGLAGLVGAGWIGSIVRNGGTATTAPGPFSGQHTWIAVLPFEDLTGTSDASAFTDAVHSDLIVALSGVASLRVISRGSVLPYRERSQPLSQVAEELGVDVLVEGGVQRLGERVRVSVQLTEPRSGELLWAESYTEERSMEDLFEIQGRIIEGVAASLQAALTADERRRVASPPTQNLSAHQYLYQAGLLHAATLASNDEAVRLVRLALELDQEIAEAWELLASLYSWRAPYLGVSTAVWDTALAYAERAVEADPEYGPAYSALASVYGHQGFLGRQTELARRALELTPSDGRAARKLGLTHRDRGEFPEALGWHLASVRLSPFAPGYRTWVGRTWADLGELEQAASWYRGVLAMSPDEAYPQPSLAALHLRAGRPDSAVFYASKLETEYPDEPLWLTAVAMIHHYLRDFEAALRAAGRAEALAGADPVREADGLLASTLLGFAALRTDDPGRAEALFEQSLGLLESMVAAGTDTPRWPYEIGLIHAARGDVEGAMTWLRTAYDLGFRWGWMLELEPMLDPLRDDPRFQSLLTRVKADVDAMRARLEHEPGGADGAPVGARGR